MTDVTRFLDENERERMTCPIHRVPFMRRDGKLGVFYSCGKKVSDGSWCGRRPPEMLVATIEERLTSNNQQPE